MGDPERFGKYELEEFLGGAMSHVYRARDTVLRRTVVVKILSPQATADPEARQRFIQEARIAAGIRHANIIQVYDFGEQEGRPYIVMEFLRGQSLGDAMKNGRISDLPRKLEVAIQAARALGHAHDLKIVHRDVKPENLFIDETGRVVLLDFGIAKTQSLSATQSGFTLGTPYYMAPEQLLGRPITRQVDIYAFGVLLYELMSGVRPFEGETIQQIFYQILQEPVKLEPLERASVPMEITRLIGQCMSREPASRPAGFREIVTWLEKVHGVPQSALVEAETLPVAPSAPAGGWIPIASLMLGAAVVAAFLLFAPPTGPPLSIPVPDTTPDRSVGVVSLALVAFAAIAYLFFRKIRAKEPAPSVEINPIAPEPAGAPSPVEITGSFEAPTASPVTAPDGSDRGATQTFVIQTGATPSSPEPGDFTRMFQPAPPCATPSSPTAATGLFSAPPSEPPLTILPANQPTGEVDENKLASAGGEFTQMFRLPPPPPNDGTSSTVLPPPELPDTALAVVKCNSHAFIGRRTSIKHVPFRIGRYSTDFDLPFDPAVSAEHAQIDFRDGAFVITDLTSTNGTFVNGRRLTPGRAEPLLFGATILLGSETNLVFVSNETEQMPDLTGRTIAGRFLLEEQLHASSKSAVYRAADTDLEQPAVVKILSPRLARHPGYRAQFDKEAKMASRLRHPQICRVIAHGEVAIGSVADGGTLYVALEYLEGGSLSQRLSKGETFEVTRAAAWLAKLCDALDHMHGAGVIHGGLKPSAIVFDSQDSPCVTDFAIAITSADQAAQPTVIGAPAFLAPEQWDGMAPIPATDQYSLAVIFYCLLTGSQPFEGQEHPEMRKRNRIRGPIPAHQLAAQNNRPPVPPLASAVLERAMSADPSQRFQKAFEFAQAFANALRQPEPAAAKPLVFLSYHRASSSAWAQLFKNELERRFGYDVFLDVGQRDTAGRFSRRIERAIGNCSVFVCILGEQTLESEWVRREIDLAYQSRKPMVPVFQESFTHPRELANLEVHTQDLLAFDGVKLLDRQNLYVDASIQALAEAIRQSISGTAR